MKEFKETLSANKVFDCTPASAHIQKQQGEAGLFSSVDSICLVKPWVQEVEAGGSELPGSSRPAWTTRGPVLPPPFP